MKKNLLSAWIFASILPASAAVTATWTGAADNYWTNAANWLVEGAVPSVCPGVVSNEVGGVFTADPVSSDRTVFDGTCTSGRTTINLEGLYSIGSVTVTGADAPKYTFGTDSATQSLPFETNGVFTVDASVPAANCPLVNARVVIPANVDRTYWSSRSGGDILTINNNGAGTLVFGGDFIGPWFRPDATDKSYMEVNVAINSTNHGGLRFNGSQMYNTYLYAYKYRVNGRMEFYGTWNNQKTMSLTYGPQIYLGEGAIFGPYVGNNTGFIMNSDDTVKVDGEGTLRFTENMSGSGFSNHGPSNFGRGRFEINTKFAVDKLTSQSGTPRIIVMTADTRGGRLVFNAPEPCDMKGGLYMTGRSIVEIPSTNQLARCPVITVDARTTSVKPHTDMKGATNTVVWTGASAETFETPVAFWGDGAQRRFSLRNEGTAALTAGMVVSVDDESEGVLLKLDGATSPVIYGATLGTAIPVAVVGDVTLPDGVDLTNVSGFMLEGGRLRCENASEFTPPPVSVVSGENVITVAGADVTVDITRTSGTLDILREDDATVVCAGLAGQSPAWLTVNGQPATVNGEGRILTVPPAHDVAIAARGDVVPDGSTQVVGITTDGTGGNDTLAAAATAVKGLVQKTAADATVAVGAGQTLSAGTLAIADGAGALTVGDVSGQGTLAAAEGGIDVKNQSLTKTLTVNAKIADANGSWIDVTGNGNVFAGGTAEPMKLKVHNGTLKLTGSGTFDLAELMVATNLADKTSTLILENAADVTYSAVDKFTAAVGGTKDVSAASTISKLVISNSTLRCDKPGYLENYDSTGYTTNTFIVGYNGGGIMEVLEGGTFKGRLIVGGPGNDSSRYGSGAVYQRDGRVELYGMSWNKYQGASYLGGYLYNAGYYELTGGELLARGLFALGINSTVGVFHQYGGMFCSSNCLLEAGGSTGTGNVVFGCSNGAMGHMYVRNGKCDIPGNLIFNQAFNIGLQSLQSHVTASGDNAFIDCHGKTILANSNLWDPYVEEANVNLIDGGRLRARGFRNDSSYGTDGKFTDPSNHFFHVWFDRGTLELGASNSDISSSGDNSKYTDLHKYGMTAFLVGPGGATVDTAGKAGNYSRKPFAAPTNGMVTAVAGFVPFKSPTIYSRKMVGAPGILINGDGKGACAEALFDSRSQMVTNVIVTSGGTGYTWAKAVFFYWVGAGGTYQTLDCTVSAPESGSFTKEGAGDFTFRTANTYGGETVLKGGTLRLAAEGALPEGTVVAYEGGALESAGETFPAELKVRIPGAENGTVRSCTLVTFTNSLPASLPSVEVVNAPAGERPCWVAMFSGLTLRTVRQRGIVVTFR